MLIANRGEIALRIIRACRELAIETVAIYSDADADALHVRAADASFRVGPAAAAASYLAADAIIAAAVASGADAIHPGYGFLSEQAAFAASVEARGIVFVGPTPETLAGLGDKIAARQIGTRQCGAHRARHLRARRGRRRRGSRSGSRASRARSGTRSWSRRRPAAAAGACAGSTTRPSLLRR